MWIFIFTGIIVIIILLILVFLLSLIINFNIIKYVLFVKLCEDKNTSVSITELTKTILYYLALKGITEKEIKAAWKSGNEYKAGLNGEYFKCFEIKYGIKSV